MTTIAYRDGILAADTQGQVGHTKDPFPVRKIHVLSNNTVLALCGAIAELEILKIWIENGMQGPPPELQESTGIHFVDQDNIWVYELGGRFKFEGEFGAWGSGATVALAAMMLEQTAVEAVALAMKLDTYTGGQIVSAQIPEEYVPPKVKKAKKKKASKKGKSKG